METMPKHEPQWENLLFKGELQKTVEEKWVQSVFAFWEANAEKGAKWKDVPTWDEVKGIYEERNESVPEINQKTLLATWRKIYGDTVFRQKRELLGYDQSQRQLDPKYVRDFNASIQKETEERVVAHYQAWFACHDQAETWKKRANRSWLKSAKDFYKEQLGESVLDIAEEQKEKLVTEGRNRVYRFFYEHFLTETIIEEHYNPRGYYDNQRYTYVDTKEPFSFRNTETVSDFENCSTGDYYHPRHLSDVMEMEFHEGCVETLIDHIAENKALYGVELANSESVGEMIAELLSDLDFYGQTFDWYYEERPAWECLSSLEMLEEAEEALDNLDPKWKEKFQQLVLEEREDEMLKKELFEKEFETLFAPKNADKLYVIHVGPPNSGKTHAALQELQQSKTGCYLGPLRLLAYEIRDRLDAAGVSCSLLTGEDSQMEQTATHIASTVEMLSNQQAYDVLAIDECQMVGDKERGFSWVKGMLDNRANEIHLICGEHALDLIQELLSGAKVEVIRYERQTPLEVVEGPVDIYNLENEVQKGDACILFSKKNVLAVASKLEEKGIKTSVVYGAMPPEVRIKQVEQFAKGETEVVVSTDAIGMGLNLPIRRVLFLETSKFDGSAVRELTSQEIKQIAGRAGRKGMYEKGFVLFPGNVAKFQKKLAEPDHPLTHVVVQPTRMTWKKFQEISDNPQRFFRLWDEFMLPDNRLQKKSLENESLRLKIIRERKGYRQFLEKRGMYALYRLLSLPFRSDSEQLNSYYAAWSEEIFLEKKLTPPEVDAESENMEELEQDYAMLGLFLLMKYYANEKDREDWEILRAKLADQMIEVLRKEKTEHHKTCKHCEKKMDWHASFAVCERCYQANRRERNWRDEDDNEEWEDFDDEDED